MESKEKNRLAVRVGARIARARLDAGLTQEEAAERLGIGSEAISRIERGVAMPAVNRLFQLAELYQVRADELLMGASEREIDQAAALERHVSGLAADDWNLVSALVEKLSDHLRSRKSS